MIEFGHCNLNDGIGIGDDADREMVDGAIDDQGNVAEEEENYLSSTSVHKNYFESMANYVHRNGHCFLTVKQHEHMIKFGHCDMTVSDDNDNASDYSDDDEPHRHRLTAMAAYSQKYGHMVMTDAVSEHIFKFGHYNLAAGEAEDNVGHRIYFHEMEDYRYRTDFSMFGPNDERDHMLQFKYLL